MPNPTLVIVQNLSFAGSGDVSLIFRCELQNLTFSSLANADWLERLFKSQ
jgi:hypothetical protein